MNILHLYPDILASGGRPADSRALISAVARLGHRCAVGGFDPPGQRIEPDAAVSIFELPRGPSSLPELYHILDVFEPDVVHFSGGPRIPAQNAWALLLKAAGIPYVISGCGNLSEETFTYRWGNKPNRWYHRWGKHLFYHCCDRPMLKGAAGLHAASPHEAKAARKTGNDSVFVAPFGIDRTWLPDTDPSQTRSLHSPLTFVYLGRLSILHKGLDLVLNAFGHLVAEGRGGEFRLILAGTSEGNSADRLKRRAAQLGIKHVSFPGGVWGDDKAQLWETADFYLHMTRFNGFSLAPREALAKGIPLITTRESDLGDWVDEEQMGRVPATSAPALAELLFGLLELEETDYLAMSTNAYQFARDTSWEATASRMIEAYKEALPLELQAVP